MRWNEQGLDLSLRFGERAFSRWFINMALCLSTTPPTLFMKVGWVVDRQRAMFVNPLLDAFSPNLKSKSKLCRWEGGNRIDSLLVRMFCDSEVASMQRGCIDATSCIDVTSNVVCYFVSSKLAPMQGWRDGKWKRQLSRYCKNICCEEGSSRPWKIIECSMSWEFHHSPICNSAS